MPFIKTSVYVITQLSSTPVVGAALSLKGAIYKSLYNDNYYTNPSRVKWSTSKILYMES